MGTMAAVRDWAGMSHVLAEAVDEVSDGLLLFDGDGRLAFWNRALARMLPAFAAALEEGQSLAQVRGRLEEAGREEAGACWRIRQGGGTVVTVRRLGAPEEPEMGEAPEMGSAPGEGAGAAVASPLSAPASPSSRLSSGEPAPGGMAPSQRGEQGLRDSAARFRAIFERAAIGMLVIQRDGAITESNPAVCSMLGYAPEDLQSCHHSDLVHPEDLPALLQQARRLVSGAIDHYQMEVRYLRRDGRPLWTRLTVSLVHAEAGERFAVAMIEDMDRHKRTEADLSIFRAVVEASAEAVAMLAPDGRVVYVNPAHERLFGRPLAQAQALDYRDHYGARAQEVLRRQVIPALRRGASWEGVLDACDAAGRVFPLWQRAGAVRGDNGWIRCYFAFMHDYTAEQRIQDELTRAKEAAEEANIAKTRFLAAASHDLRQPLQALSMFVAVLSNREHGPQDRLLIGRIEDSVGAVETLLNGLLDVSKLEAGLVVPEVTAFSLTPLMTRLAAEFEPLMEAAGLELHMVPSSAVVLSDAALLERILRNLLNNALRYTPRGRVLFGCRHLGDRLRIAVCDTGIGIPLDQQKLIFREFHQLGNPGRDRRQGLGLGLAIVERLAHLLDHGIAVRSQPERGSTFAIDLPLASGPGQAAIAPRRARRGRKGAAILLIDDEPDVLDSTRLLLESWGFKVVCALNGEDALRRLPLLGRRPDLILADYRLQSGATGGEAVEGICRRLQTAVPAIILTGDTAPERLRQARASGHKLLHKPVQPALLRQMIDDVLGQAPAATSLAAEAS